MKAKEMLWLSLGRRVGLQFIANLALLAMAGIFLWMFTEIKLYGQWTIMEPNHTILNLELGLFACIALLALVLIVSAIRKRSDRDDRVTM